jgi:hypothetical protein
MTINSKEQKIDEILGKALRDREFRAKLTNDPKAAAEDCGLSVEEMDLIAGGLAIGDSLLNPETVAWCTNKTCNETGSRQRPGRPAARPRPATKPKGELEVSDLVSEEVE